MCSKSSRIAIPHVAAKPEVLEIDPGDCVREHRWHGLAENGNVASGEGESFVRTQVRDELGANLSISLTDRIDFEEIVAIQRMLEAESSS